MKIYYLDKKCKDRIYYNWIFSKRRQKQSISINKGLKIEIEDNSNVEYDSSKGIG